MKTIFILLFFFSLAACGRQEPSALDEAKANAAKLNETAGAMEKENDRLSLKLELRKKGLSETEAETYVRAGERNNSSAKSILAVADDMIEEQRKAKEAETEKARDWDVSEREDKMGRGKITTLSGESINEVNFSFPYEGEQRLDLRIRSGPGRTKEVLVIIPKGQFNCNVIQHCVVNARFGKGKMKSFRTSGSSDGSPNVLFIEDAKTFISNMLSSEQFSLEVEFYQAGRRVFDFDATRIPKPSPI